MATIQKLYYAFANCIIKLSDQEVTCWDMQKKKSLTKFAHLAIL